MIMFEDRLWNLFLAVMTIIVLTVGSEIFSYDRETSFIIIILIYVVDTNFYTRKNKSNNS